MSPRRLLVAGNWKMHGTLAEARERASALRAAAADLGGLDVFVAPPFVYIAAVADVLHGSAIAVAGQDVSEHGIGAHTGEVSGSMLSDTGCTYVLVGHSERRAGGESDARVAAKCVAAIGAGLMPIVCVGETSAQRDAGETVQVVSRQLEAVLGLLEKADIVRIVVAYEPVWAIGTGRQAMPADVQEVHERLRQVVARHDPAAAVVVRVIYGGSVKAANAASLVAMRDVDGLLVGGASLHAREFLDICAAARAGKN